jgi:2',3'-cyclic-nucleotide 2'-phosphodiesterase (5'-nucleotidase family)
MFAFSVSDGISTMRRSVLPGLTLAVVLLAGCIPLPAPNALSPLAPSPDAKAGIHLTIVHSNDTWGYLTPCG